MATLGDLMKLLVGAACVAIIAFVGYYFWNEYSQSQARAQHAQIKAEQEFELNCKRISLWYPQYDDDYANSFSKSERANMNKECNAYIETGKLPEKSAP